MIQNIKNIHFTADLYFRNQHFVNSRGFENTEAMEKEIIQKWNEKIKPDDTVYILGGFCSIIKGATQSYINLIAELNGKKHFILSSRDAEKTFNKIMDNPNLNIESVSQYKEIMIGKQNFVLMHYPLMDWKGKISDKSIRGSIHLHAGEIDEAPEDYRFNVSYQKNPKIFSAEDIWKKCINQNTEN